MSEQQPMKNQWIPAGVMGRSVTWVIHFLPSHPAPSKGEKRKEGFRRIHDLSLPLCGLWIVWYLRNCGVNSRRRETVLIKCLLCVSRSVGELCVVLFDLIRIVTLVS